MTDKNEESGDLWDVLKDGEEPNVVLQVDPESDYDGDENAEPSPQPELAPENYNHYAMIDDNGGPKTTKPKLSSQKAKQLVEDEETKIAPPDETDLDDDIEQQQQPTPNPEKAAPVQENKTTSANTKATDVELGVPINDGITIIEFPSCITDDTTWDKKFGPQLEKFEVVWVSKMLGLTFEKGTSNYPLVMKKKKPKIKKEDREHPKVGDHIIEVDGTPLIGMTYDKAVELINSATKRPLLIQCIAALPARKDYKDEVTFNIASANTNSGMTMHQLTLITWRQLKDENPCVFRSDTKTIGPSVFDYINSKSKKLSDLNDDKSEITVDEVIEAMKDEHLKKYIKDIGSPALNKLTHLGDTGLGSSLTKVRNFPKKLDKDGSGSVSKDEWIAFFDYIQEESMLFLRKGALLKATAFMGLGLEPGEPYATRCSRWLGVPRGYWEDLVDYTKNNHPLFVMFLSDKAHPYGKGERFLEFIGMASTALFGTGLNTLTCDPTLQYVITFFAVNLPQILFRTIAYYCFTNACLIQDRSKMGCCMKCLTCVVGNSGMCLGFLFTLAWASVMIAFGVVLIVQNSGEGCNDKTGGEVAGDFFFAFCQLWVIWFIGVLLFDFNPSQSFSRSCNTNKLLKSFKSKLVYVGIRPGRWHCERDDIQALIIKSIETYGKESYFLSEAAADFRRESLSGEPEAYTRRLTSAKETKALDTVPKVPEGPPMLHIKIPKGAKAGKLITVQLASGAKMSIKVPKGAKVGQTIKVVDPEAQQKRTSETARMPSQDRAPELASPSKGLKI